MDVIQAIRLRRAYRSLDPVGITDELITDLAEAAQLAPSCNNFQPWRYVFVYDPEALKKLHATFSKGNEWMRASSMIIAVFSKKELDCVLGERIYHLFDTGMATAFMILRATELGLVAHPVAGYDEGEVKSILGIPEDMRLITLVNVGKHSDTVSPILSEKQKLGEKQRPERLPFAKFAFINQYQAVT